MFDYRKGRGLNGPKELLQDFSGYLQTDGYPVYDALVKNRPEIRHVACLAHVRRKYIEAQNNDRNRADHALGWIAKIYEYERVCKDYMPDERMSYRLEHIKPIIEYLKEWIEQESIKIVPKSAIGKAIGYHQGEMQKLMTILNNGAVEMDNNLIENKIRPLALGRKNYLFAGSHESGKRMAMMYSFFATCKVHDVNPRNWLQHTLDNIKTMKLSEIHKLIPGYSLV